MSAGLRVAGNQQYLISLDSLDLQQITRDVYGSNNETIPLWTKGSNDHYYEFKVIPDDSLLDDEDDNNINKEITDVYEKYTCYICNVKVPSNFAKEHTESMKHITFTKLTEIALERVVKNMNNHIVHNITHDCKSTHYCDACSEEIINKDEHENSKKHLNAVKFDDKMKLLLNMYIGKGAIDSFDFHDKLEYDNSKTTKETTKGTNPSRRKRIRPAETKNVDKKKSFQSIKYDETIKSLLNLNSHSEGVTTDGYLKKRDHNNNAENLCGSQSNVVLTFEDRDISANDKATRTSYNYGTEHYVITDELDIRASTVSIKSKKIRHFLLYITEMIKLYKLKEPIPKVDGDSILIYSPTGKKHKVSVDNFHSFVRNIKGFFCILCQFQVNSKMESHAREKEHVLNIFKPIDEYFTRKMNQYWSHCVICNEMTLSVETHASMATEHRKIIENLALANKLSNDKGPPNSAPTAQKASNNESDFSASEIKLKSKPNDPTRGLMKLCLDSNIIQCKICLKHVPNRDRNIAEHMKSKRHRINVTSFLIKNKLTSTEDGYQCFLCNVEINDIFKHVHSINHSRALSGFRVKCDVDVPDKDRPEVELGEPNKLNNDKKVSIDGNAATKIDRDKMKSKIWQFDKTNKKNELVCRICRAWITDTPESIKEHFDDKKHNIQYFSLLFEHSIVEILDSEWETIGFECEACDDSDIQDFIDHIKSFNHYRILAKYKVVMDTQ